MFMSNLIELLLSLWIKVIKSGPIIKFLLKTEQKEILLSIIARLKDFLDWINIVVIKKRAQTFISVYKLIFYCE